MSQKYTKLKSLLKELFQLDQPDLDFGLYRIMHAEAAEVTAFLERDLLPQVKAEFGQYKTADKSEIEAELAKATDAARGLGVDPETTQKVKDLRARLKTDAVDIDQLESEVYDHLVSFFSRYYSDGDFLSKRRYSRDGRYAIPYDGEEVKLYWANHDQYYIKTSEYLRDYALRLKPDDDAHPMRVHFTLADVAEGEHGNVKPPNGKDRVFILHAVNSTFIENGELFFRFEYRPATLTDWPEDQRTGKAKPPAQKDLIAIAEARILATDGPDFAHWIAELSKPHVKADGERADYNRLRAHLNRYVARNTFDYFIHKDLGGFLGRELDFFIKNEVMMLDDIENETAPRVEQYLSKIKVIRRIAGKIIVFLAQLEDFQKALWLKKKFVVETQWCVALKEIPAEFHAEVAANAGQLAEWKALYGIEPTKGKATGDGGLFGDDAELVKLSDRLRVPGALMIDTCHFDADFTARLLEALGNLEARTDGVLFHSENFQALSLMQARYRERVKCVYIDPPYNTAASEIIYKNEFKHSSWLALMHDRLGSAASILGATSSICVAIDDAELNNLVELLSTFFSEDSHLATVAVRSNPHGRAMAAGISVNHEYAVFWGVAPGIEVGRIPRNEARMNRYQYSDASGAFTWINFRKTGADSRRIDRPKLHYPVYVSTDGKIRVPQLEWRESIGWVALEEPRANEVTVLPIDDEGDERVWTLGTERVRSELGELEGRVVGGRMQVYRKYRPNEEGALPGTWWDDAKYSATESGTKILTDVTGSRDGFSYPKSVSLVEDCLRVLKCSENSDCVDFFAGSGTTGHAVINLNREDGGRRKFILVEMGHHFDTVLLPRLKKVAFTPDWKDGKPKRAATAEEIERGPRLFKIIRLESYEDTLNNLEVKRTAAQQATLDFAASQGPDKLREQYLLQYLLKVETQGSPSLLNVAAFSDPTAYRLKVKRPGSDESREVCIDLIATFNWLLGLTVEHVAAPQVFSAKFERDAEKRLRLKGRLKPDAAGPYWFRTITGTSPDGRKTLVIWRKLTGNPEEDNLVLDEWFTKQGYSSKDSEFDLIHVNGGNNLENLKTPDDTWKVRLIEDDFHRLMFAGEGV